MKTDILKRLVWTMLFLLPFLIMWIATVLFFDNEYLPMWHMHRYYLFVWIIVPVAMCFKKRALAVIISLSYTGSVLLAWLIGSIVNNVTTPESLMVGNSRRLLIWLITFCSVIVFTWLVKVFWACRAKRRVHKQG